MPHVRETGPKRPSNLLTFFLSQLSNITGMTEVTNEEPTDGLGAHTTIRMKGSNKALYDAQRSLAASVQSNFTWEPDTPTLAGTTNATHSQLTVLDKDKTFPHYFHTPKPGKEDKEFKERADLADKHSGSPTTPQTQLIQEYMTGAVKANVCKFGFIAADDGQEMIVLPGSCPGFNWSIPAIGTRVTFRTTWDTKTNKIRPESVRPEGNKKIETKPLQHKEVWTHPPSDLTKKTIGS